jgi:hypothetical protein
MQLFCFSLNLQLFSDFYHNDQLLSQGTGSYMEAWLANGLLCCCDEHKLLQVFWNLLPFFVDNLQIHPTIFYGPSSTSVPLFLTWRFLTFLCLLQAMFMNFKDYPLCFNVLACYFFKLFSCILMVLALFFRQWAI